MRDKLADGSTVTVFSMTPETGREVVRKALAMGADDAVMLSDPGLAGSDLWATAYAIAHGIKAGGFDLVLTGTQSTDAISGDLPGLLGLRPAEDVETGRSSRLNSSEDICWVSADSQDRSTRLGNIKFPYNCSKHGQLIKESV